MADAPRAFLSARLLGTLDNMGEWLLFRLLTVALLILATAFFVAAEFAIIAVRETRLLEMQAENRAGASAALRLKREIDDFLAANQLGVTLCSLALGWLGEQGVAEMTEHALRRAGSVAGVPLLMRYAPVLSHTVGVAGAFLLITFLEVVLGEQVPKSLSLQRSEHIALAVAGPMDVFIQITRPAVRLLKRSTAVVLRLFRVSLRPEGREVHSPEEIKLVATATRRGGRLPEFQERMIHHVIDLNHVTVREIMTPRGQIFCLPADMPVELASARIVEEQHSRVPVYDPRLGSEHILGIVYSKDVSRLMHFRSGRSLPSAYGSAALPLRTLMREALVVPETKLAVDLLQEFQERRRQMAIVVDEFGSTVGLVTAEDALEQVVGELHDEFDGNARLIASPAADGSFELDGTVQLRDLVTQLHWIFPRVPGVETLAGFLLAEIGHLPEPGEFMDRDGRRFTVLERNALRISRIRVEPIAPADTPDIAEEQALSA